MSILKGRIAVLLTFFLIALFSSSAQTSSLDMRFGGHKLGERAKVFFKMARTSESQQLSRNHCKALLKDDKAREKVQQAETVAKNGGIFVLTQGEFTALLDVDNCRQVMEALDGKQANVGARLASELGKGSALFASGRVRAFNLILDTSYTETVSDMARRFGSPGKQNTIDQEMRWERDGVLAAVWKDQLSGSTHLIVGFLEPPYESFLLDNPGSEVSTAAPWSANSAKACIPETQGTPKGVRLTRPHVELGRLVSLHLPVYPESARQNRIAGVVVLEAVIDQCGNVVELKPLSGPEELVPRTITAAIAWKYRPFRSEPSGQPTAIVTRIQVRFALDGCVNLQTAEATHTNCPTSSLGSISR